jgi:hypothetical protein
MVQNHRNIFAGIRIRLKKKKRMLFRAEFRILLKKVRNEYLPAGMNADGK